MNPSSDQREKLLTTAGYYAGFIGLGAAAGVIGPTLPGLAQQTQSPLSTLGFLFTARSLGYLLASWRGGKFYDRLPGHPVAAVALVCMAGLMVLIPLLPWLWVLTLATPLIWLSPLSPFTVASTRPMSGVAPARSRTRMK